MTKSLNQLVKEYGHRVMTQVDDIIRDEAGEVRDEIINGWPVDSGASRAGWQGPIKVGHGHYQLRNAYPYAATIEYGGYPGVGPKTERVGAQVLPGGIQVRGGIYPTQKPAAPVARALSSRVVALREALTVLIRVA